jgi:hypothetical protein
MMPKELFSRGHPNSGGIMQVKASQHIAACVACAVRWWCWGDAIASINLSPLRMNFPAMELCCRWERGRSCSPDPSVGDRLKISSKGALAEGRSPGTSTITPAYRPQKATAATEHHAEKAPFTLNGPQQQGKHKSQPQRQQVAQVAAGTLSRKPSAASPAARQTTNTKRLSGQAANHQRQPPNARKYSTHQTPRKAERTSISDYQPTLRHSTGSAPQHAPPPAEERQHSTQRRQHETPT